MAKLGGADGEVLGVKLKKARTRAFFVRQKAGGGKLLLLRCGVARRDFAPMDGVEEGVDVVGAAVLVL